ncbi:MAG: invasion associated locus B family protein [Sulfitobacter sp.]
MFKFLTALPLCIAFGALTPVTAWSQTATTDTEAASDEAAAPKIEDSLSLGEDADKDPELGKLYVKETIGAWSMRCVKTEQEEDPCQMYQLIEDSNNVPVAEISLFRLPEGGKAVAGANIVAPLETSLAEMLTLRIDGGSARRYPFAFCAPIGCYARLGLTADDINGFKKGNEAVITIVPALAPDQKVEVAVSLEGFTKSYDVVSVIEQP